MPGSSLQFTMDAPSPPDFLGLVQDERFLLAKRRDRPEVHVFDMLTGQLKDTVAASNGVAPRCFRPTGRTFTSAPC